MPQEWEPWRLSEAVKVLSCPSERDRLLAGLKHVERLAKDFQELDDLESGVKDLWWYLDELLK